MKIECHTRELLEAVNLVAGVVSGNTTRPILRSLLLKADANGLVAQGTDMDVALSVRVDEVEIHEHGSIAIPAARLHSILREVKGATIAIELNSDSSIHLTAQGGGADAVGKSRFKVPAEPAEEFPELEFKPPSPSLTVQRQEFLDSLRSVSIAAARDATRFQMHSVMLNRTADKIRLVSTDGKRMAIAERDILPGSSQAASASDSSPGDGDGGEDVQYIVPLKGVDLLQKILSTEEGELIELHLDHNEITYSSDRVSLSCRLVEGRFPPYERAIPSDFLYLVDLPTEALQIGLRQASLMTTKETNSVQFAFDGDSLTLTTQAANVGESRIELTVERPDSKTDAFTITFNPQFMLELIRALDVPVLRGQFKDSKTAGLFSMAECPGYRHIVMPLVTGD